MTVHLTEGFQALVRKSFAIITSSIASLSGSHAKTEPVMHQPNIYGENFNSEMNKLVLGPQLILKLNKLNPDKRLYYLHTSHSSHASHASHASHYSSSPNYPPSPAPYVPPPPYTPPESTPIPKPYSSRNPDTDTYSKNQLDTSLIIQPDAFRTLFKGCEGNDVQKLQNLLIAIGYNNLNTSYFGEKTELAVIKFQIDNELKPDGRVTRKVYLAMRKKLL